MATNDRFQDFRDDAETTVQSGVSVLKSAVALSPVAAGVWYGARQLKANQPINDPLSRAKALNPMQTLGRAQGLAARRTSRMRNERAAKLAQTLAEGIQNSNELRDVVSKLDQHNALLQSLSVAIENPGAGLDTTAVQSLKSEIERLLSNASPEDVGTFADRITKSILSSGNGEVLMKWREDLDEFQRISSQLETPNFSIPTTGKAFNAIDVGQIRSSYRADPKNASRWQRNFMALEAALPPGFRAVPFAFDVTGPNGQTQTVRQAQILGSRGYRASIPLGGGMFASGESFNTLYATPRFAMDMQAAHSFVQRQGMTPANMSARNLYDAGLMQDFSSYMIGEVGRRSRAGTMNWREFNRDMRQAMMTIDRNAVSGTAFGRHVLGQTMMQNHGVFGHSFGNMNADDAMSFVANMSQAPGFDAGALGAKRLLDGFGDRRRSIIGFSKGSSFSGMQQTYGGFAVNRHSLPLTYRESQIVGRVSMAADPMRQVGSSFIGGTAGNVGRNMGWGSNVSGGLNKMMVMDFSAAGSLTKALGDTGMAYTGIAHEVVKPFSFSVFDPKAHGYASSQALNQIMSAGSATWTAEQMAQNIYLGETSSGRKFIPRDPSALGMTVAFDRAGTSSGKNMLYFRGQMRRRLDYMKLFSFSFKGNVSNVGQEGIDRLFQQDSRFGRFESDLAAAGISGTRYNAAYAASDTMKKGSFSFTHQIASSARMFGVSTSDLKNRAAQIASAGGRFGKSGHGAYAQAAFELMSQRGVSGQAIGMTLAGVFHGAEGAGIKGHGLDQAALRNMVRGLGGQRAGQAMRAMERGLVAMIDTAQIGESAGDWGAARVGAEARFAKTGFERMMSMGMGADRAAEIMGNIYSNKIGFGKHYALADQLVLMGRGLTGSRNFLDAIPEGKSMQLKFENMATALHEGTSTLRLNDLLKNQAQGTVLDFSTADTALNRAVVDVFGQDSIFLPGTKAYEAAVGTEIKQAGGQSMDIAGAYGGLINSLETRLSNAAGGDPAAIRASLEAWKGESLDLVSNSIANLSRGKIRGSSSPRVAALDLTSGLTLNREQFRTARSLFGRTKGTAVFANATMMLSELHGQTRGGTTNVNAAAEQARMFFTGMEGLSDKAMTRSGLVRMSGRHPIISAGNVFFSQMYRDVREVGALGGRDQAFGQIMGAIGDQLDADLRTLSSFQQLAKMEKGRQRAFFQTMVENIDKFTGGQGGGVLSVPTMKVSTPGLGTVDLGLSPQAFMDMDGDTALSVTMSTRDSTEIRSMLANMTPQQVATEMRGRVFKGAVMERMKAGLTSYGSTLGAGKGKVIEDIMKEVGINQATGTLDTRFKPMHDALISYGDGGAQQRMARDFLGALEETVLLKAKKLDSYTDIAGEVGRAVDDLIMRPNDEAAETLRYIMKNKLFRGQETAFSIGQISGGANASWITEATATGSMNFDVDSLVDQMYGAARQAAAAGTNVKTSVGAMKQGFVNNADASWLNIMTGAHMEGAALGAATDSLKHQPSMVSHGIEQLKSAASKLDKRMAMPLALGGAASMLVAGAIGASSYAPAPLTAPGEYVDPAVADAISQGSLFQTRSASVSPESLQARPASDYGMIDRTINQSQTYVDRPTSYSVRGDLTSSYGLQAAVAYMQRLSDGNAYGSIRVNDTRRPITSNYVDRLTGEY